MFFLKKKLPSPPKKNTIECFVRYATLSSISCAKKRLDGFSHKRCYENLLETADKRVNFTFFLDSFVEAPHFLKGKAIEVKEGTEAGSFLRLTDYVNKLDLHPETIVYFLEDDYLHRPGWVDVLFEGFSLDVDYVTLYDHSDKYTAYPKLKSRVYATNSCHWRTTPSTTNTYAMRFKTFQKDFSIHQKFSKNRKVSQDHEKFCYLMKRGSILVSSIPGFSTHVDPKFLSPCIHWNHLLKKEILCKH